MRIYAMVKDMVLNGTEKVPEEEVTAYYKKFAHKYKLGLEGFLLFAAALDNKEKRDLAKKYFPLAQGIAKNMAIARHREDLLTDMIGIGNLALAEALNKYDTEKFTKVGKGDPLAYFGPYAKDRITKRLLNFLKKETRRTHPSLEKPLKGKEGYMNKTLGDVIQDEATKDPEAGVDKTKAKQLAQTLLKKLSEQQKFILIKRYNLDNKGQKSIADIAVELKVTRATANNWHNEAIKKMRRILDKMQLSPTDVLAKGKVVISCYNLGKHRLYLRRFFSIFQ